MSDALYPTRLRWCAASGVGAAIHGGLHLMLPWRPPVLMHVERLIELEYSPGSGIAFLQTATDPRRELLDGEPAECLAYLRHLEQTVMRAAKQGVV